MPPILVDTDILVDHLRGVENARAFLKRIEKKEFQGYFSAITEAELYAGKSMGSREVRGKVAALLSTMKRVPVNSPIARKAGELRRSNAVLLPDAIIAASALIHRAELATRNLRDFRGIKGLGLKKV